METFEQFNYLRRQRCDEMQGFLFSPAVAPGEIAKMMARGSGVVSLSGAAGVRQTVLLVEADAASSRQLQRALASDRWSVLCAASADEAMRLLACHEVGVVVTTLELPDRNGSDFLERIQDMYPDTARILMCSHADFHGLADAVNRAGVFRALSKPVDPAVLAHMVDEGFFLASHGRPVAGRQPLPGRQVVSGA